MAAMNRVVWLMVTIAVGFLVLLATFISTNAANRAKDAADRSGSTPAATSDSMPGMDMGATAGGGATPSFAGASPKGADVAALAAAHTPYPAALPPVAEGPVADVTLTLTDRTIEIAPGVKYTAWTWSKGAPGPVIHVRQGQRVRVTLTNDGAIPHSVDFHAARVAPNVDFVDVQPGKSMTYTFTANDAGVFMYHCGTKPVLAHISNGMYGAIVVDPAKPLPHADEEYVLVSSEWYLNSAGTTTPAQLDMGKAQQMLPDWVTWNGYANQYVTHPLTADPGDTIRFYVLDAGPSLDADFHVVGTLLDRAYVDGDVSHWESNVQTVSVPAGGGAIFDLKIDQPGLYPFVSHSFAAVDLGEVGLLNVGNVKGTMSH
jgi:nitrite reductase (NO-forming)